MPNQLDTDFKAVVLAAELIESGEKSADEVIVLPIGARKSGYAKEIEKLVNYTAVYKNRQMTSVYINREGLYDMMPEGLFHKPPASSVMISEEEMIRDIVERREEEKQARQFFAPFEAALNELRVVTQLYESRLDKKHVYDDLISVFVNEWKEFDCFTKDQMVILLQVFPVIHERRNDLDFLKTLIAIMFEVDVSMKYQFNVVKLSEEVEERMDTKLGVGVLGLNFMAGRLTEKEEELKITFGPSSAKKTIQFLPGSLNSRAINVLLSYFIPLQTSVKFDYLLSKDEQRMVVGDQEENACMGFTAFL